jgi:hypothetical protein
MAAAVPVLGTTFLRLEVLWKTNNFMGFYHHVYAQVAVGAAWIEKKPPEGGLISCD